MHRRNATLVSLHAAASAGVALCASIGFAGDASDIAPEWVHLLPAGEIRSLDGRGPYRVGDPAALIAESMQQIAGGGVVDENHATDLAAPRGEAAPARGWIRAFEARTDGIWGRVEWTAPGSRLVRSKAYRGISPVIQHRPDGTITAILRASLVNRPNLRGLTALHQENDMELLAKLLAALGLPAATTEDGAIAAVIAMHAQQETSSTALQAALAPIAKAVGLAETADAATVLTGVTALKTGGGSDVVTALQQEITTLAGQVKTLTETGSKERATTYVDGEIKRGRAGLKPLREHYISMHMADPARVEKEVGAMIVLGPSGARIDPPANVNGETSLNAEQSTAAKVLGLDPKAYAETLKAEREAAL